MVSRCSRLGVTLPVPVSARQEGAVPADSEAQGASETHRALPANHRQPAYTRAPSRPLITAGSGDKFPTWRGREPAVSIPVKQGPMRKTEDAMDWNRVEGNWKQVKGKVKEKWGKLTDDDLNVINGRRDQLEGKLQERYGYAKDQARKDIDDWYGAQGW